MGEFRIGRKYAQHSYPDTPRSGPAGGGNFARNFAKGPGTDGAQPVLAAGTQISWGTVDVPGTSIQDVPITPQSTGVVRVSGVVTTENDSINTDNVTVQVQVDGVTVGSPTVTQTTGQGGEGGFNAIPFNVELTGLAIGVQVAIQILVTAQADSEIGLTVNNSTVDVQEVPAATG